MQPHTAQTTQPTTHSPQPLTLATASRTTVRSAIVKVSNHRGHKRVWLQGKWLAMWFGGDTHFTVNYHIGMDCITIKAVSPDADGARKSTFTARGAIIDLSSKMVGACLRMPSADCVVYNNGTIRLSAHIPE